MKKSDNDAIMATVAVKTDRQLRREKAESAIRKTAELWPSGIVARGEIPAFTGGAIAVGTIANADSRGEGPEGSFKIGRNKCYSKDPLVDWIISKLEV